MLKKGIYNIESMTEDLRIRQFSLQDKCIDMRDFHLFIVLRWVFI